MIAIIRTRPPFARVEYEPYHFLRWASLFPEKEFVWLTKNPNKIKGRFGVENFPDIKSYDMTDYFNFNTVEEKIQYLNRIVSELGIIQLITIHNDIRSMFKGGSEEKGVSFFETQKIPTFSSIRSFYEMSFIGYHLSKNLPTLHIFVDPQEGHWHKINGANEKNFFFYKNPRIKAEYFPFVEWSFAQELNRQIKKSKKFSFGFTVVTEDREYLYHQLITLNKHNINFLVKFPKLNIDTTVKRSDYAQMLEQSEFTLVIPSYEDTDFSSIRFWDALTKDCIPFILDSCQWEQAFIEHPEISEILKEDLLVSVETVKDKIENTDHSILLKKIKSTSDWKKLKNQEWFLEKSKSFFDSLVETTKTAPIKDKKTIPLF